MMNEDLEMIRCKQLFARLSEFIDGQLSDGMCQEIEAHLSDCQPCVAFLRTLKKTVEVCQTLPYEPLSAETRHELKELLEMELSDWKRNLSLRSSDQI